MFLSIRGHVTGSAATAGALIHPSLNLLLRLCSPAIYLWGSPLGVKFLCMWPYFWSNHIGSHILSSWMVHAGCVFVASIHLSRTWMSGSFESMRWNACVHRLNLSLYSHPKQFWGNGVRIHVTSRGKSPLQEKYSSEEDRTHYTTLHNSGPPVSLKVSIATCKTVKPTNY